MTERPETNREAALDYLLRHWSVIPLRPRDKRPAIRWQEYQYRLASAEEIESWFKHWPDANVGIVTGIISGLVVVDVDPKHGGDQSLAELERAYGTKLVTLEAATGGGGRHVYFTHPGGVVHNKVALAPGIDFRGDGGYVVAPPSLHRSGNRYVWSASRAPHEIEPIPLPQWLLQRVTGGGRRRGHSLAHWRSLVKEGVAEGQRNNTIASLAGHLLWHGVDPDIVLELLLSWNRIRCRPPLPEEEVTGIVSSISRLHEQHDGNEG